MEQMEEVVVADQAGGNHRPAKVGRRRRRTGGGGGASEVAHDDTPGAGGGGNGAGTDDNVSKAWLPQMLCSAFLMAAKARHYFTHPPAWLSRAREAGGDGEHHHQLVAAARVYESLSALTVVLEAAILMYLCLFQLEVISAGRARAALRRFMVVSFVTSIAAFAVTASVVGGADAAVVLLMALPNAAAALQFAREKLKEVLAKVGELVSED